MKKIFVILAVGLPLGLAVVFIANNVVTDTFPMFRESPMNELDYLKQTYEAGLEYCKNNYGDITSMEKNEEYRKCVDSVETWHTESLEK